MKIFINVFMFLLSFSVFSQYDYEVSKENPYGKYNPKAPKQLQDYKGLIGSCKCKSESRNSDGTWNKPVKMIWKWKYIMNGTAVQDMTLKEDGNHSGSIRQYNKDSLTWYVHYFNSKAVTPKLRAWSGNKNKEGNIVLYMDQKSPNGTEGTSRLTFYDIDEEGYKWVGEWVDKTETVVFPFWKISCDKRNE